MAEILGMTLPGCGLAQAVSAKKRCIAKQPDKRIVEMLNEGLTARKILTKAALRNGVMAGMAMGASTNSALHLPAIAHEAGVDFSLNASEQKSALHLQYKTLWEAPAYYS